MSLTTNVLISGVFDPLHAGHLAYIRAAGAYGPVTCVLSDAPEKHPSLVPMADRSKLLKWLGVERVLIGTSVADALLMEHPHAYVKGSDWRGHLPVDQIEVCAKLGIQIVYTDTAHQSSSLLLADYEHRRNADKLAAFESFVQQQQPAEKPWEPVTDYSFEARKAIEGPHAQLIYEHLLQCEDADVLDFGCGPDQHLVQQLRAHGASLDSQVTVVGYDPQIPESERYLSRRKCYDLVICREVLEHLTVRQIAVAVCNLVKLSSKYVYVTTRFAGASHLLEVDGSDTLDPTHITMLNQDYLRSLFVLEGCTRRADLEQKLDWKQLGRVLVYEVPV